MIPFAAIPPPIITPSEITIGLTRSDAAMRHTAQMLVPIKNGSNDELPLIGFENRHNINTFDWRWRGSLP